MMTRPYLILPVMIEQPTWGGEYIASFKGWSHVKAFQGKKIGQSYELYGKSTLLTGISDTTDKQFVELASNPLTQPQTGQILLEEAVSQHADGFLGRGILEKFGTMPLLIKFTQALGNSFQLHVPSGTAEPAWKPKPESWYYLENGVVTFGIHKGTDFTAYEDACKRIETYMKSLSSDVKSAKRTLGDAKKDAQEFIRMINPWQYVNVHKVEKHDLIDLSRGGLHHSWEEDAEYSPLGNILYEVQQDVEDGASTIRSFDQGKMKDNGDIRDIHIEDYFAFLDTDESHNDLKNSLQTQKGNRLLTTPYYCLDSLTLSGSSTLELPESFSHIFVQDGDVEIHTTDVSLRITKGHSCFLPYSTRSVKLDSRTPHSTVLHTYIDI